MWRLRVAQGLQGEINKKKKKWIEIDLQKKRLEIP